ncbi:secretion/conjugation apparatus DotM-related subunit [Vibrio sp. Hal054]|uniref:secretion/conjugation apparatus DotM-related subunit n=1 Tax=Vibrio sp. Hal054 TaxID=3035158 RepID=UPI00301DC3F7
MSSNGIQDDDIMEELKSYFWLLVLFVIFCFVILSYAPIFFAAWSMGRMVELYVWDFLSTPLNTTYFSDGIQVLKTTKVSQMSWTWLFEFEAYYNNVLRYFYASFFLIIGAKIFYNYLVVTKTHDVQSMLSLYARENAAIESLVHDNPLKYSRIYDFTNRDDYHNRHAQAMQPTMFMTACPPPNASRTELQQWNEALALDPNTTAFRPIAIIDRSTGYSDFSRSLAKRAFERQLTSPPVLHPAYVDEANTPRLFDENGVLIDLEYNESGLIVGGFATNHMINNGRDYNGSFDDMGLLFNGVERDIFYFLCDRYRHPTIELEVLLANLINCHAYTRTFFASFLQVVRHNEIIASTEFYLLCREDRALYFTLYSAGEEKPFWEATGIMAHHAVEVELETKVTQPQVIKAVDALEEEFDRVSRWKPNAKDILTRIKYACQKEQHFSRVHISDDELAGEWSALDKRADSSNVNDVVERNAVHHE